MTIRRACRHPLSCSTCQRTGKACGTHFAGITSGHERCSGSGGVDVETEDVDRTYCIGIPMAVTVRADGSIVLDFDLCEIGDIDEDDEAYTRYGALTALDCLTVSAAASRIGNHHQFIINPTS